MNKKSNGDIEIQFSEKKISGLPNVAKGLQPGDVEMAFVNQGVFSSLIPDFAVLSQAFLFQDPAHFATILDGDMGAFLAQKAEAQGIVILGYWSEFPEYIIKSRRPITSVADLFA